MKRISAMAFLVGAAAIFAAACGGRGKAATLTVWALGREGEVLPALVGEFERAHPALRVAVQQIPWTAAHEKLLTAYVGESMPDVMEIGNTWVPEFAAIKALKPIDAEAGHSSALAASDFFPGAWDSNIVDGHLYGIPWYVDTRILFYRTDLLARAGVSGPPRTWTEWIDSLRKLKAAAPPGGFAILLPTDEWAQPIILGMQLRSGLLRDGGRYGDFEAPPFRRAFEFYVDLFRDGFAPAVSNVQVANVYQQFAHGDFAMYITGPWNLGEFRRRLPRELASRWTTAPLPGPGADGEAVSIAGGASLTISASTKHPAEAWKLVEFLSSTEAQARFHELTGDLPARVAAWQAPALANDRLARAFWDQLHRVRPLPKVPECEHIARKVAEYAEMAIRGRMTTGEALAALDRDTDLILEKRRDLLARRRGGS